MQFKDGHPPRATYAEKRNMVRLRRAWREYMVDYKELQKMGHFDFVNMTLGGMPIGELVRVSTATGIALQCPPKMDIEAVNHMAAMARANPDALYDLSLWEGPDNDRRMTWTARIVWRER